MNLYLAFQTFLSYLGFERDRIAARRLKTLATSEKLDKFLEIENSQLNLIQYFTDHGFRTLSSSPEHNQFIVAKKGNGFARARDLPYVYLPRSSRQPSQLIVLECNYADGAINAGYSKAIDLPYRVATETDDYPLGTIVVALGNTTEELALKIVGYANAVPIAQQRKDIYIEDLGMLDTDYAAMLVQQSQPKSF